MKKNNTGALFKNNRKVKETHPDYSGNIMVDGVDYYLSGWLKEGEKSGKYFSLSVKAKEEKEPTQADTDKALGDFKAKIGTTIQDDEIPF